ncbi:MAG: hypothetical protein JXO51_06785 [Candidatus Aminicenantes bacterium]|nr:hypothetical protein [Candidatus Aminicenantes bacterium]
MSENADARLEREGRVFGRYLLGREAGAAVGARYAAAHGTLDWGEGRGWFERLLLAAAARHPLATRACDAYSRFLCPNSLLRRKLILLLAILELTPPFYREIDAAGPASAPKLAALIAWKGLTMAALLLPALVVLLPLQAASRVLAGRRPSGAGRV